jgi:hypothetical protein
MACRPIAYERKRNQWLMSCTVVRARTKLDRQASVPSRNYNLVTETPAHLFVKEPCDTQQLVRCG